MHKRNYNNKKKTIKLPTAEHVFRFFNNSIEYFCVIKAPVDIPKYRIKEIFDQNFVGKKIQNFDKVGNPFYKVSHDITYFVTPVKGEEQCQTNK